LYQSARKTRAKRRNSKPSANSGLGRMVAGEALKIVSIFPVVETAAPVWFMAGGNPAAPRECMAGTDATPARADTWTSKPVVRTRNRRIVGVMEWVTCIA